MSKVFANAAMDRIARVAQIPLPAGEAMSVADFVRQTLVDSPIGIAKIDPQWSPSQPYQVIDFHVGIPEWFRNFFSWDGDDFTPTLRFVSFAGLVELGVEAGYISLEEWEDAPALKQALPAFVAKVSEVKPAVDLRLLDSLLRRFEQQASGATLADAAFASFESYLHLTSRLRADGPVLAFLRETHTSWKPEESGDRDRSALLSPRHFAEAFATGVIAGVPVSDVAAGVGLLRYFEWLAEILGALDPDSDLCAGIVRHARWAHGAARVQGRFDSWVEQMREWNEGQSDEWPTTAERLFGRLAAQQGRLIAFDEAGQNEPERLESEPGLGADTEQEEVPATERIEQLVAEGRIAAARQLALAEAKRPYRVNPRAPDWLASIETLVKRCQRLVELGSDDAAAALVAPVIPTLTAKYRGSGYKVIADALAIVARARQGGPRGEEEGQAPELARERDEPPVTGKAEESLYRALDESL
ncbi:MAG TPA: hypothetical protein VGS07_04640 [Thermoanaerobaculia bacterium]|jgi:hypothetical protein|nr:hypothetical protein [Thermoanaerobaculia bacterium]